MKSKQNESLQRKVFHINVLKNHIEYYNFTTLPMDDSYDDKGKMNKKHPVSPSWNQGSDRRAHHLST